METGWTDLAFQWQLLLGAVTATSAAVIAFAAVRWSAARRRRVALRNEQDNRRARRLGEARAEMPDDLGTIIAYAHDCIGVARKLLEGIQGRSIPWVREHVNRPELTYPDLPQQVVSNLENLSELLDAPNAGPVSELLGCLKFQHAQLADKVAVYNQPPQEGLTKVLTEHNVEHAIRHTLEVYLRAASMSGFARGREERIGAPVFTSGDVANALHNLGILDAISKDYERELRRSFAKERDVIPG